MSTSSISGAPNAAAATPSATPAGHKAPPRGPAGSPSVAGFFRRSVLGRALWTFRRELMWVGVFSLFANLLALTPTLYMLQVFDRVMISGSGLTLVGLTLFTLLFFCCMGFAEWVRSRLLVRAGVKFDERLSGPIFNASFEARLSGSSTRPLQALNDLSQLRQFLSGNGTFALFDTPWTLVYIAVLFLMHPVLGWSAIVFSLVLVVLAFVSQKLTTPLHEAASDAVVETNATLNAKLRNAEVVQTLGMQNDLRRQWLVTHVEQLGRAGKAQEMNQRLQAAVKFVQYAQQSLMLAVAALLVIDGEIGVGAMIASNALMANALRPIGTMVSTWRQFVEARQAYGRLELLLEEHPPRQDLHAGLTVNGQVTLKNLEAQAPGREQPILKGLNAEFTAGEVVAIVGPSGAGKSTLARCIVGIWPQTRGNVLLDGHPVHDWSRETLGPQIGYLPQDIELFDGSIAENIARFGAMRSEAVIDAAQRTGIHDMVLRFPRGYDTPMGEAGSLLSAGQRQRIGLARAIYGNPKLVVLDEPNANLDDVGEAALIRAVRELKAMGSTVFLVAHQRAVLAACDRALVLNDGTITQLARIQVQSAAVQAAPLPPAQPLPPTPAKA